MSLLYQKHASRPLTLDNRVEPELYRDVFPYTHVSRIEFDDTFLVPRPADPMFITDTTFRDGQQARPPYTVKQIARIYDLLHKLGGKSGLIQASEFFMYSPKDRKAIEVCRARGYRFPRVTGWIRANMDDLKIAHDMEFDEVGLLTSMSDYHIFLKLGKTREQAMNDYLKVVTKALEWGIVPRCHFEDVTRADIYGFCLPFARKLMELSHEASMPIKIRLCDTMGYGVPFPGAALPRSVQRIVRAFTDEAGVPGAWLEWHGHNDFHKVLVNGVTAWLYGCGGVNGTLMGFGERTGNAPLEALVIDYISLTGNDEAADPTVITEIAQYFEKELDYRIPDNYPFAGKDFNATSAGIHVDGLAKNEEIYNIFDTTKILNRSVPIIINDKAGRAGVAYWINQQFNLPPERQVSKKHPAVGQIHTKIMAAYEEGRNTSFSNKEIKNLVRRFMPELFDSEFDQMKRIAGELASNLVERLSRDCQTTSDTETLTAQLQQFVRDYSFIQYVYVTDVKGHSTAIAISDPGDQKGYKAFPIGFDYSNREWFQQPMRTGKLHIMNVHQSQVTGQLIITVSTVITDANDEIIGVLGADIQLEEIIRRAESLEAEEHIGEEE
ncbi:MAG: histone-lysine N-methyltransferase [Bilophila sp.]|uniref:triose-phosphate isomerase n=1 Tax=Bilophila TaxID=35832 RepID=UPI00242DA512|nr:MULTISPECIES: cache domain-containing protein [Bilophila]MBS5455822.1 histone-lysine N-methyltransferase [Bilophila sp.]